MKNKSTVHIIAGPTASGKSSTALERARTLGGVIINADSMQIYNALPTLTAQPSQEEQEQAPHRLYGTMHPSETCNARMWRDLALQEIYSAREQGLVPVIVGGTGLYIKALTKGLSPVPNIPGEIRTRAIEQQKELGNPAFHEELSRRDPVMAERLNPNDTQRLVRAWEVLEGTGESLSYWQSLPLTGSPENLSFKTEIILPDRELLYERCNARFDSMIEQGILDEVKALDDKIKQGSVPPDASITNALGFSSLQSYLQGDIALEDAIAHSKQETRNYAKRQTTWIRNQLSD